ncbi:MAG: chorismate mutase [Candidatus Pacearchaeota archaeon]|jgi:chorismate mutase/prephenate dehydratase
METNQELKKLRNEVDILDKELIKYFKKRFEIAKKIWKIKKPLGMKIKNSKREMEIIEKVTKESGFDKRFVKKLYNFIFEETRKVQRKAVK